ncbi:MAG: FAD-dependent oxidoreductase [Nitrospirae bacterium]|nr:FAD-dependent oxidoreductase [Nitrospirota bacterium]
MNYVIIGNSYAGIGAVEGIRERDRAGEITMISDEPYLAYARPLISYNLEGRVTARNMYYRSAGFYKKNNVRLVLGKRAAGIDTARRRISLEDGAVVPYDRLLIGTGGRPFVPPMKGLGAHNVFCFTKWDDAKGIKRIAPGKRKAVVIGGGLIGLKAAEGINALGLEVTIVELGPRVLAVALDEVSGAIVNRQLRENGIRTVTGHTAKEILSDRRGNVCGVILDDDRRLECEILVIAIGVRPNVDLAKNTSLHIVRGIVVDKCMMTNIGNVYAAGDVVEAPDILNNRDSVIAIVPLAYEQGRIAGCNMAGGRRTYAGGIGMNSVEVYGLPVMTMGITNQANQKFEVWTYRKGKVYRKLVFEGIRLVGAVLVGQVDYGGVLTHFVRSRTDVTDIKEELTVQVLKQGEFGAVLSKIMNGGQGSL